MALAVRPLVMTGGETAPKASMIAPVCVVPELEP